MIRKIIQIDEEKCDGCGLCAKACHEGAIEIGSNGKARLARENFCDGFGDCLPACPQGAISFTEREAPAYDEQAVLQNKEKLEREAQIQKLEMLEKTKKIEEKSEEAEIQNPACDIKKQISPSSCPGHQLSMFNRSKNNAKQTSQSPQSGNSLSENAQSMLSQWPCQIKLIPPNAPYFEGANLLIAADCTAYAFAAMHERFMKNKITLIGCPKLDSVDYSEKLSAIITENDIKSVSVVRMEVPCCGGIERAVKTAIASSGKLIPWRITTISIDGTILSELP